MMTVIIPSTQGHCKGVALIQDLRSIWLELAVVLANNPNVKEFAAGEPQFEMIEIMKKEQANV